MIPKSWRRSRSGASLCMHGAPDGDERLHGPIDDARSLGRQAREKGVQEREIDS